MSSRTLVWFIILRLVSVSTLLVSALIFQFLTDFIFPLSPFFYLTGFTFFASILYILLLKTLTFQAHVYLQCLGDLGLVTGIVFFTGGYESSFSFLYLVTIIVASLLIYRRGGLVIASLASIFYGALVDFQYYGILPIPASWSRTILWSQGKLYYNLFVNIFGFFLTAFLVSLISEKLRRTSEALSQTSSKLHQLQSLHEQVLNEISAAIMVCDYEGKVQYKNPSAEYFFPTLNHVVEDKLLSQKDVENLVSGKGISRIKIPWKNHVFFIKGSLLTPQEGFILVLEEVSELDALERELREKEKSAALGTMAAALAHEIRNPLASLMGAMQMLTKKSPSQDLLSIMQEETGRLKRTLDRFLHFVQESTPVKEAFDVVDQLDKLTCLIRQDPSWKNITITLEKPKRDALIEGDPDQVKQIWWNLLLNAYKAMEGKGSLKIRVKVQNKKVEILVEDTGPGIPKELYPHIFEPFTTHFVKGLGLGLTMAKRYAELNGGTIRLLPSLKGAVFAITFPLKKGAPVSATHTVSGR